MAKKKKQAVRKPSMLSSVPFGAKVAVVLVLFVAIVGGAAAWKDSVNSANEAAKAAEEKAQQEAAYKAGLVSFFDPNGLNETQIRVMKVLTASKWEATSGEAWTIGAESFAANNSEKATEWSLGPAEATVATPENEYITFTVKTADKEAIASLEGELGKTNEKWTLKCALINNGRELTRIEKERKIEIKPVEGYMVDILGGKDVAEKVRSEVEKQIRENTAKSGVWECEDFAQYAGITKSIALSYQQAGEGASPVNVVYNIETKEVKVTLNG